MSKRKVLLWQVGILVILTALAKLVAFVKDLLLSLHFGAGPQTDAYFVANAIPSFVFGGVFATIGLVFMPEFKRAIFEGEFVASTTYRTAAIGYSGLSALLGICTFFCASFIVSALAPGLPQGTRDLAVLMTQIMAFSFVFSGWVGLQNAVLQSHKKLIWPQVVQILNHAFVIGGLALAALSNGSIIFLVYSAVIGWVVVAPLVSLRTARLLPTASGTWFDSRKALSMAALSFPVFLSLSLDQANILVGTYLASSFPEGAISHLNYAHRLLLLFSSVFSMVIAYVLFPYLTESIVANRVEQARYYIALAVIAVLLLSAPLLVLSTVTSEALVSFVFERGEFKAEDAVATGYVMAFFSPVIVLAGLREVLNRLFLAWQNTKALLWFSVLAMVTNVIASVYFSRMIGLEGIALGATCGASVYVMAQLAMILIWHRDLLHRDLPLWIALIATATLVSGMAGRWLASLDLIANARLDFLFIAMMVVLVFAAILLVPVIAFRRFREIINTGETN